MATDIVGSLFGVSPEMYQEDRNRQGMRDAIAMAQLDPMQMGRANIMAGAGRAAGGFAGLMGVEDPQMRLISIRNSLAKQFDLTDLDGLAQYANALQQAGDTQGALGIVSELRKVRSEESKQSLQEAQTGAYRSLEEERKQSGLKKLSTTRSRMQQLMDNGIAKTVDEAEAIASNETTYAQAIGLSKTATTASERNRKFISDAEVKLSKNEELTPAELAQLRFQIATEIKPKIFRDTTTGELTTIEPLDINLAAPNVAKALGLGRPEGAPAGTGAKVIETPASKEAAVSQAEALGELTNKTKDVISLIGKTRDLINPYSTGYGSFLKILPNTDAKSLENNLNTIKSNLAFAQLTALKDATKTGASGLGAVTVKEFEALQNSIAALDPSSKTFTQDLDRVEATYTRLLNNLEKKTERAETKAGIRQPTTPVPTATPTPALTPSVTPKTEIAPNKSSMSGTTPSLTYGLKDYTRDEMINHVMAQYPKLTRQQAIDALTKAKARGF
jgi:hypothetical protein